MEKYIIDGETYYLNNGKWLDSSFLKVPMADLYRLNALRMKKLDFSTMQEKELIEIAQGMKDSEDYIYSTKIFEALLEKTTDVQIIKSILPRYTSILRRTDKPNEALSAYTTYYSKYGKRIDSSSLYTSLAGAYCDIGDPEEARKTANRAMAISRGNAGVELQSVYARIKSLE